MIVKRVEQPVVGWCAACDDENAILSFIENGALLCDACGRRAAADGSVQTWGALKNRVRQQRDCSANLASSEDGWSKMKAALKLQATIELQCCDMSDEEVNAKLASLGAWQEAVKRSHPADRRSLLADILYVEAAGSGEDSPNVEVSDAAP